MDSNAKSFFLAQIISRKKYKNLNSLHEDLKEILSREKIKEGQTDPRKTSEPRRMIVIREF